MTPDDLTRLRADLAYRYAEYVDNYVKEQFLGYSERTKAYIIVILSGYIYLMEIYDIANALNTNLLTATQMNKILLHINKLLNVHYTYRF
jgi:predicted RNA-binding protein associated with RNAse of E/G family